LRAVVVGAAVGADVARRAGLVLVADLAGAVVVGAAVGRDVARAAGLVLVTLPARAVIVRAAVGGDAVISRRRRARAADRPARDRRVRHAGGRVVRAHALLIEAVLVAHEVRRAARVEAGQDVEARALVEGRLVRTPLLVGVETAGEGSRLAATSVRARASRVRTGASTVGARASAIRA